MTAQNISTGSLYSLTEDPGAANTNPVARPKPGDAPLRWYRNTKPRFYRPYLVRVVNRNDTMMEFVFLNAGTGADMALSKPTFEVAYHDGRYSYSALPATAPKVQPGTAKSCGLLFLSDDYMQSLPDLDRKSLIGTGNGENKYPIGAGKFSELIPRLHAELSGRLSPQEEADLSQMIELLKAVT